MSQSKLLAEQVIKAKQDIKTRYLAGESVPSIATSYDVSDRNIYYHLGTLSPDDKALHIKNAALRRMANKRKEEHDAKEKPSAKSTAKTTDSSLSDFVE